MGNVNPCISRSCCIIITGLWSDIMEQLFQNTDYLNKHIQKTGCKYIDHLNIYQEVSEHQLEYPVVNAIYEMCVRAKMPNGKPYMTRDCFVYDVPGIIQITSGLTGIPVYMEEVQEYEEFNFRLGYFKRVTSNGDRVGHFVELFLDSHSVKRDPWKGGSRTAREGVLAEIRHIYTRRLG